MRIDQDTCLDCQDCIPYCPVGAIDSTGEGYSAIDLDECVECGVCLRNAPCPTGSILETDNPWPRSVRAFFSNPLTEHKETRIPGRGTEEMKTNDVTGRFQRGEAGLACEVGRPGTGTRLRQVQVLTSALAGLGISLEPCNPLTRLIVDEARGLINPEVLDEKVLSAIVEFKVPLERLPQVLACLQEAARQMDTVFSVDLISKVEPGDVVPLLPVMQDLGIPLSVNGKNNMGLGRPLFVEEPV
jgi:ferredoxin